MEFDKLYDACPKCNKKDILCDRCKGYGQLEWIDCIMGSDDSYDYVIFDEIKNNIEIVVENVLVNIERAIIFDMEYVHEIVSDIEDAILSYLKSLSSKHSEITSTLQSQYVIYGYLNGFMPVPLHLIRINSIDNSQSINILFVLTINCALYSSISNNMQIKRFDLFFKIEDL